MGLFDIFRAKEPSTLVTEVSNADLAADLVEDLNYYDQFELYTYKAVKTRADAKAQYPPRLLQLKGADYIEVPTTNPLLNDLYLWNPWQTYTQARMLMEAHKALTGSAVILLNDEAIGKGHKKYEFYLLDPTRIEIDRVNGAGYPETYKYTDKNGKETIFPREMLIVDMDPHPGNWLEGWGPLRAALYPHNTYEEANRFNFNRFANEGRADGFMVFEGISDDERKKVEDMLKQKYKGSKNARKTGVLNHKFEFIEVTKSQKELDFTEGLKLMREDILAIFGVPAPLVGITSGMTFNNISEAQRIFQQYTIKPILDYEADMWTNQLIPRYFGTDQAGMIFEATDPVEKDKKADTEVIAMQLREGIITRNEAREMLDLDTTADGDVFLNEQLFRNIPPQQNNVDIAEVVTKQIDDLKTTLAERETKVIEDREMLRDRKFKQVLAREPEMRGTTIDWFTAQGIRLANNMQAVTLKGFFNKREEDMAAVNYYEPTYLQLASDFNGDANIEVKMALEKVDKKKALTYRDKALSGEALALLRQRLELFAGEINRVTQQQLEKVIAQAITDNLTLTQTRNSIVEMFNDYIDGGQNVATLSRYDVYKRAIEVAANDNTVQGSNLRYNTMYELLGNATRERLGLPPLTKEQRDEAVRALKGIVTGNPEPNAQTINNLLISVEGLTDEMAQSPTTSISFARAETIARTETNAIKGMVQRQSYEDNDMVHGLEWLTARDSFVRTAHAQADGQVTPIGKDFIVGGEFLSYPGDMKGAPHNTINCRCDTIPVVITT